MATSTLPAHAMQPWLGLDWHGITMLNLDQHGVAEAARARAAMHACMCTCNSYVLLFVLLRSFYCSYVWLRQKYFEYL